MKQIRKWGKLIRGLLFGGFLAATAATVLAGDLPAGYPQSFENVGTISRIDRVQGEIVVGDRFAWIPVDVPVHSADQPRDSILSLKVGVKIGYQAVPLKNGQRRMTEIWILPASYQLPQGDD